MVEIIETKWETELLRKPSYKILIDKKTSVDELRSLLGSNKFPKEGFVSCRVPIERIDLINLFEENNFNYIETYLSLKTDLIKKSSSLNYTSIRIAKKEDETYLRKMASESFFSDRFHMDPKIPNNIADQSRAEWIANALSHADKEVYVYESDNKIVSFIVLKKGKFNSKIIDLIATHKKERGKGIGSIFLNSLKEILYKKGIRILEVGSQLSNIGAVKFYIKNGFSLVNSYVTLHRHI